MSLAERCIHMAEEPRRTQIAVYRFPRSERQRSVPVRPTLRHFLETALPGEAIGLSELGTLTAVVPEENGYVAQFAQHPGHPALDVRGTEAQNHLALRCSAAVVDAFTNSGVLTALDNVVYGQTVDGVLEDCLVMVETDD